MQLAGGQKFTKLDMSQAYQQICLDDKSKNMYVVTLSVQPFTIWKIVSSWNFSEGDGNPLCGIPKGVVYLDDILITGSDDAEHLDHLSEVLTQML